MKASRLQPCIGLFCAACSLWNAGEPLIAYRTCLALPRKQQLQQLAQHAAASTVPSPQRSLSHFCHLLRSFRHIKLLLKPSAWLLVESRLEAKQRRFRPGKQRCSSDWTADNYLPAVPGRTVDMAISPQHAGPRSTMWFHTCGVCLWQRQALSYSHEPSASTCPHRSPNHSLATSSWKPATNPSSSGLLLPPGAARGRLHLFEEHEMHSWQDTLQLGRSAQ